MKDRLRFAPLILVALLIVTCVIQGAGLAGCFQGRRAARRAARAQAASCYGGGYAAPATASCYGPAAVPQAPACYGSGYGGGYGAPACYGQVSSSTVTVIEGPPVEYNAAPQVPACYR